MKCKKTCLFLLICLFLQTNAYSQKISQRQEEINTLFKDNSEIYFKFNISDRSEIHSITDLISIDKINFLTVFAYANKQEFANFLKLNFQYTKLVHPGKRIIPNMANYNDFKTVQAWNSYPTYPAYDSIMHQFELDYPELCKLETIGVLPGGRKLFVIKISDSVAYHENEPQFLYTSTMHGDETTGYILMLHFIDYLLSNYGYDQRITNLVNNIEIRINPLANPDGTYAGGNNTVYGATRYNANAVDLNRNYPDPQNGPHPDGNAWQPETQFFMDFADSNNFVMAANFHGGAELMNYPWDTWATLHADNTWWIYVANEYADTAQALSPNGYLDDFGTGITNGYLWYEINGGRQDYMNYFQHCREITIELSNIKLLPASQLQAHWDYNCRSLLNYLEQVLYGVRGIVTDSLTGKPLVAKILIAGHDIDSSTVYSSLPKGNYHRPIYTGNYSLTFSAPGYYPKILNNISVTNKNTIVQDVQLVSKLPVANFVADDTSSCVGDIIFNSNVSASVTSWLWDFGDGNTSTLPDPSHTYTANGVFDVKLTVTNSVGQDSLIRQNYITIFLPADPVVSSVSNCGPASFTISATGTGLLKWYDAYSGGNLLDTGGLFITPYLASTTIYYLQNEESKPLVYGGKTDNSGGGGYHINNTAHYLVFDCFSSVKLISVKVYASSAGNRIIQLRNFGGSVIQSDTIYIPNGQSRIILNFDIPVGTDLQLAGPSSPNLYRNNSGLSYPYTVTGLIDIKHSSATSNPTGYYYYFYDWEIEEAPCLSQMLSVCAYINVGNPVADFNSVVNTYQVAFTDLSFDANDHYWDFDDGNTSYQQNPIHIYSSYGTYVVKLKVTNACGYDSISIPIIVNSIKSVSSLESLIKIFPNPSNGVFNINMDIENREIKTLQVFALTGQTVYSILEPEDNITIDLSFLKKGIYFINFTGEDFILNKKLMIK